ncbi:MAG: glycosyltransferase, partial [Gammaproteobacteria bacterium]
MVRVGYILCYRDPYYIRSVSLIRALRDCPDVQVLVARNASKGLWRYVETWRALRYIHSTEPPDIYILGFRGHEIFWPVRLMIGGIPLVFDGLMSPYAALKEENKAGWIGKVLAPLVFWFERHLVKRADLVLTDTHLHASRYVQTFGLAEAKLLVVPVGAIEHATVGEDDITMAAEPFSVLFYGSFLPLHGVD